jgi:hypothetical protein
MQDPNDPKKQIPKGSNEGFTPQSGSDAFLIDQGFSIADTGAIRDAGEDKRITFTDSGDTILRDEAGNAVLYVDTNERIGILKADPTVELEVEGTISASTGVYVANNKLVASSQTGSFASGSDVGGILSITGSYLSQGATGSLTNITASNNISASGTITALQYGGDISGSSTSTGSFGYLHLGYPLPTSDINLATGSVWVSGSGGGNASGSGYIMVAGIHTV